MSDAKSPELAIVLLRMLPPAVMDQVLARLGPKVADELRARLATAPPTGDEAAQRRLLREFFKQHQNATQVPPPPEPAPPTAPTPLPAQNPANEDPVDTLRALSAAAVARVVEGEIPPIIATVIGLLGPESASDVMKRLPAALRSEVAVCLTKPGQANLKLRALLAQAVVDRAGQLAAEPAVPTDDERARSVAAVLRRLDRAERVGILAAIEQTDAKAAADIRKQLFQFEDLLLVTDRGLQELLMRLELRTLAAALNGAESSLQEKILRNLSTRTRQLLLDEISALTSVPQSAVLEARQKVADALRRAEEEGKITLG